jgi:D-psicose/D-tagatose/L-ribulose 3-epimerase
MPRYGSHAFVWIGEWTTESGNHAIRQTAAAGFDFIEIPLLKPETFDAASHKQALKAAGIEGVASLVLPKDSHLPDHPDRAQAFLTRALDKLEAMGGTFLGGCIGYSLGTLTGKPPQPAERQAVVEVLGNVAADAKRRGITLALEACNRYETYLFNSLADTRDTIKAIGADNLLLHADTYHMNIEERGFYQPIVNAADVLGYIHMSESHRGLVGTGTINWDELFRGLADAHYTGPLVLESFATINPDLAAATCLWRPPQETPEMLAAGGLNFLKTHAEEYGLN